MRIPISASTQLRKIAVSEASNPATVINLELDQFQPLRLEVVDRKGNLVKTLAEGLWAEGTHQMAWHFENEDGDLLEGGVYYVRLSPEPAATEGLALAWKYFGFMYGESTIERLGWTPMPDPIGDIRVYRRVDLAPGSP